MALDDASATSTPATPPSDPTAPAATPATAAPQRRRPIRSRSAPRRSRPPASRCRCPTCRRRPRPRISPTAGAGAGAATRLPPSPPAPEAGGGKARMKTEEDEKEIEATKAPLMEHLIELRSRLIKALIAFFLTFIVCFFFAKQIYNVLVWPFVWVAGPENIQVHLHGAARISSGPSSSSRCSARRSSRSRWSRRRSTCSSRPASIATSAARSCRIWSRRRSSSRSARLVVYFLVMPLLVQFSLGMQQLGGAGQARDRAAAQGRRISRPDHVAGPRLRHRVPACR